MKLVSGDAGSRDVTSGSIYQDGSVLQTTDIKTLSSTLENGTNMLWMDLKAWREQRLLSKLQIPFWQQLEKVVKG